MLTSASVLWSRYHDDAVMTCRSQSGPETVYTCTFHFRTRQRHFCLIGFIMRLIIIALHCHICAYLASFLRCAAAKVREFESKRNSDFRPRLHIHFIRLHQNTGGTSSNCRIFEPSRFSYVRAVARSRSVRLEMWPDCTILHCTAPPSSICRATSGVYVYGSHQLWARDQEGLYDSSRRLSREVGRGGCYGASPRDNVLDVKHEHDAHIKFNTVIRI